MDHTSILHQTARSIAGQTDHEAVRETSRNTAASSFYDLMTFAFGDAANADSVDMPKPRQQLPGVSQVASTALTSLNELDASRATEIDAMLENGIYSYVQENWFESMRDQATRETLQKYSLTQAEYDALPETSPLKQEIDQATHMAMLEIFAERLRQASENQILEIVDLRTRMRAQVLGRQGISPGDWEALSPARQAELEAQVRKEMLNLQALLRDGYSFTEAFQKLALA